MRKRQRNHRMTVIAGAAVLAGGLVLSACGGSQSASPSTSSSTTPSTSSTSSTSTTSGGSTQSQLQSLEQSVQNSQSGSASYSATYTTTSSGSKSSTVTFARSGSDTYFAPGGGSGSIITNSDGTYFCSASECIKESLASNPMAGLFDEFDGTNFVNSISASTTAAAIVGVTVTTSSATYGGLPSTCVSVAKGSNSSKWCVANSNGLMTYYGGAGSSSAGSFQLTSYSSSPQASLFKLPAGATITTL